MAAGCAGHLASGVGGHSPAVTIEQVEELRSIEALLPIAPDSVVERYRRYDPQTFHREFEPRLKEVAWLVDSLNAYLEPGRRIDTLSVDHTFEQIGTAARHGQTLYISSSYFFLYDGASVLRSIVCHEFGHIFFDRLVPEESLRVAEVWRALERAALFYVVTDGEYSGNSRFGGHPEDSPAELYASGFNLFLNRPREVDARLLFVPPEHHPLFDTLRFLIAATLPRKVSR
jgi:hypothetical protein